MEAGSRPISTAGRQLSLPLGTQHARSREKAVDRVQQVASRVLSTLRIRFVLEKCFSSSGLEWQPLPPSQLQPGPARQLPKIKGCAAPDERQEEVSAQETPVTQTTED